MIDVILFNLLLHGHGYEELEWLELCALFCLSSNASDFNEHYQGKEVCSYTPLNLIQIFSLILFYSYWSVLERGKKLCQTICLISSLVLSVDGDFPSHYIMLNDQFCSDSLGQPKLPVALYCISHSSPSGQSA